MKRTSLLGLTAVVGVASLGWFKFFRRSMFNWGATEEEAERRMPGDEIVPDAAVQTTRAATVDASPEHVWPWLVQMGPRPRAGAYTYDWIERRLGIDIENTDRILPEFQHLEAGEAIGLNERGQGIQVRQVEPERFLVLQWIPAKSTWAFGLYPDGDGHTRLVSRNRLPGSGPLFWLGMAFMVPGSLIMERKMLLGIKQRAERLAREE